MRDKIIDILNRGYGYGFDYPNRVNNKVTAEILALFAEPPPIEPIEWAGLIISFTPAWGGYVPTVSWEGQPTHRITLGGLKDVGLVEPIDPVKWGEVIPEWIGVSLKRYYEDTPDRVDKYLEDDQGIVDTEIIKE